MASWVDKKGENMKLIIERDKNYFKGRPRLNYEKKIKFVGGA